MLCKSSLELTINIFLSPEETCPFNLDTGNLLVVNTTRNGSKVKKTEEV